MAGDIENDPSAAALDLDNSEAYDSAEDEDFQLDEEAGGGAEDSSLSSSEDEDDAGEGNGRPTKRRKLDKKSSQKRKAAAEVDQMELDSGDEITIQKAKNKKKKGKTKGQADEEDEDVLFDEDEEGGEGGFVKTRSMRMKIQEDRKPLARIDGATIDVDAIWAQMNAPESESGLLQTSKPATTTTTTPGDEAQEPSTDPDKENIPSEKNPEKLPSEDLIKIKRTYKFAGEMHTEEKLVPRDSAEAKLYLAETNGDKTETTESDGNTTGSKLRRPLRKISRFDPNPSGVIKKSWEKQVATADQDAKGPKLNTVEKSRLDWAQYVDEEGIKDELNVHSKAKEGYLGRMDFLDRVDAKREEERRNIRLKGL